MTTVQGPNLRHAFVLEIGPFGFWICFGFRYSNFEFFCRILVPKLAGDRINIWRGAADRGVGVAWC